MKIEPLETGLSENMQKYLDRIEQQKRELSAALMIPTSFFNQEYKQWSFTKYLYGHRSKGMWWFRLFGYGIHAKNTNIHDLKFSERIGATKTLRIGNWSMRWLMRGGN